MVIQCGKGELLMTNTGHTNKTKQYAVLWLNSQNLDIPTISKELNLSENTVSKILENFTVKPTNTIQTTSEPAVVKPTLQNNMITSSMSGRQKVAIMTKEASALAEEHKKHYGNNLSNNSKSFIFKPNS